ncbi:transcriptional regulator, GntR family [Pseudonocardia thermophila]|uniref:Transcriptional regulator, GntR family n=1 Tax=Pseudonocardia thermophila TaxID=1848 RepID=A0A1M6NFD5_PSETH|nr:GntR family transcriptional regulator [Pseudonocardia thermophila]SHJ94400.1 transcriptional regulator, GntR family [Pseudonocardia thermophila]
MTAENPEGLPSLADRIGRVAAPLRVQVLEVLREAILTMRFKPGQRLVERELIEMTGVSRTTIREVLRELAAEGLVRTIPQKGAVVLALSPDEAEELYDLREVLERHLVERFVERASDSQLVALRRAFTHLEDLVDEGAGTLDVLRAKDAMYDVLLTGAGNSALRTALSQLHARVSLLRAGSLSADPQRPRESVRELREVVKATEARDAAAAGAALIAHVRAAARLGIAAMRASEAAPAR